MVTGSWLGTGIYTECGEVEHEFSTPTKLCRFKSSYDVMFVMIYCMCTDSKKKALNLIVFKMTEYRRYSRLFLLLQLQSPKLSKDSFQTFASFYFNCKGNFSSEDFCQFQALFYIVTWLSFSRLIELNLIKRVLFYCPRVIVFF